MVCRIILLIMVALAAQNSALPQASASIVQPVKVEQHPLAQYNHRAWRLVDGAPPDIWALAQAPDGFLWLGTGAGLFRFDGIVFEDMTPSISPLPSRNITALLTEADGTIWIGHFTGEISRLRGRTLKSWNEANATVEQFARGPDGTIWAAKSGARGGLFRFDGQRWHRIGRDQGVIDGSAFSVLAARDGSMWVATDHHVLVRPSGNVKFQTLANSRGTVRLAQAPDGEIWAAGDVRAYKGAPFSIVPPPPGKRVSGADRMIFTRDGALWETAFDGGIIHVRGLSKAEHKAAQFDFFLPRDGLTSPIAVPMLEDREGNVWVGTNLGLNRLRPVSARTVLGLPPGLRGGFSLASAQDGSIYIASKERLFRARPNEDLRLERTFDQDVLFAEPEGDGLILGQRDAVLWMHGAVLERLGLPIPPAGLTSWARDEQDTIWVSVRDGGIYHLIGDRWRKAALPDIVGNPDAARVGSGAHGSHWIFAGKHLLHRQGDSIRPLSPRTAPNVGRITTLSVSKSGTVLIGGETGVAWLDGNRFHSLTSKQIPELSRISGLTQTNNGDIWANGVKGLVRIRKADLDRSVANPHSHIEVLLLNAANGLPGVAQQDDDRSTVIRGGDGRIWVANNVGVGVVDPESIIRNTLAPPVVIRQVDANGRTYESTGFVPLPAGTQNLRITYTALSLAASERVQFRYRLIGVDSDWIDAGTRREAFYAHLPPGRWRFQVVAANNDGVWNQNGASIEIAIAAAFYQTWWFRLLALSLVLAAIALFFFWRIREHSARAHALAAAQIGERERIARELHDTLLQGMQGLMLRFQAAANAIPAGSRAHELLERALERADDVILDARDRVRALRNIGDKSGLKTRIDVIAERYREDGLPVTVQWNTDDIAFPCAITEHLSAVVEEALSNVLRHAKAGSVSVTASRTDEQFALDIVDNGVGIPDGWTRQGHRPGHFGLLGMRERVDAIGGRFAITPATGGGTCVAITIPYQPRANDRYA